MVPGLSRRSQRGAGGIEDYVHRIGRTARGGKESTGRSITYFTEGEDAPSARALVEVLEGAGQAVPSGLAAIVASQGDGSEIALATAQREAKKLAKKAAKVARPGDWQCPKCSARVFAKHSKIAFA
jgi:superfamily II DNA/RNA helicase